MPQFSQVRRNSIPNLISGKFYSYFKIWRKTCQDARDKYNFGGSGSRSLRMYVTWLAKKRAECRKQVAYTWLTVSRSRPLRSVIWEYPVVYNCGTLRKNSPRDLPKLHSLQQPLLSSVLRTFPPLWKAMPCKPAGSLFQQATIYRFTIFLIKWQITMVFGGRFYARTGSSIYAW